MIGAMALAAGVYASPGMTYSQAAEQAGVPVSAVEAANPWPATAIPVGVTIRTGGSGHSAVASHARSSGARTWGITYGYPNRCGDGDGDGWDVNCTTRSYVPKHSSGEASAATGYVPRHAASTPVTSPANLGGSTAIPAWASCIVQRESGGNPRAVNSIPGYIGNGGGLFGDLTSTWGNYGGYHQPFQAPVSVQIAFNQHLKDQMGLSPWAADGCPGT